MYARTGGAPPTAPSPGSESFSSVVFVADTQIASTQDGLPCACLTGPRSSLDRSSRYQIELRQSFQHPHSPTARSQILVHRVVHPL